MIRSLDYLIEYNRILNKYHLGQIDFDELKAQIKNLNAEYEQARVL